VSPRRELSAAGLLCLLGAVLVLVAAGRTWTSLDVPAGPLAEAREVASSGTVLVPGVPALGLAGLAGVVALAATRRAGRVVVGVVLLLVGAGTFAAVLLPDLTSATLRAQGAEGRVTTSAWPSVTAAGGLLVAAAGGLTVLRGRSWPALGQRYETPAAVEQVPTPPASERSLWEALDRGEDPTDTLGSPTGLPADREADRT
jgi:uncharacterized membrane protein (TIGR02234 family)